MHVAGLWRYPVKSLGREPLEVADLTPGGIAGDRVVHVRNSRGLLTGRVRHALLTLPSDTAADGTPQVAGHPWDSPQAARLVKELAGEDATLASYSGPERFDVGNLLVATDGTMHQFGEDIRRVRPNILVAGVAPADEADWPGRAIAIGGALIGIHSLRDRCVVTSIDPDTGERNPDIYRRIRREFAGQLCLNAWVIRPGTIGIGDEVELVDSDAEPLHLGGWVVGAPYET
jgi:uncharacterized protein YcbX